jgi:hypothetical protein
MMKKHVLGILAALCMVVAAEAQPRTKASNTNFAQEALQPYVDNGQLAGAISIFYKDGVQEVCCIG